MGLGREVADAYISVHGDMAPFRRDLDGANADVVKEAKRSADSFSEAWGKRLEADTKGQWQNILNTMYSGDKLDFNRMMNSFDSSSFDDAQTKMNEFLLSMRRHGKLTADEYKNTKKQLNGMVDATNAYTRAQQDLVGSERTWGAAHARMMDDLAAARQADADQALTDFSRMQEAQDRYNKSFEGMMRANRMSDMTRDFQALTRAMGSMDFSKFANGFKDFDTARDRVVEVTTVMGEMGRISQDNSDRMVKAIDDYITAETDRRNIILANEDAIAKAKAHTTKLAEAEALKQSQANGRALQEAKALLAEQERYNRSLEGMGKIAAAQKLERDFRNLADAVNSNDWSGFARGANNIRDLRKRTMETANAMFDMGRVGYRGLSDIETALARATANQKEANIAFGDGSNKMRTFHGVLSKTTAMFGGLFAASKGFREHMGGFAGINVFGDMLQEGLDFIHNLDRIALSASLATTKLATMASIGGSALSSLITVAADLGPILGGLGAALPGFAIGAGIQIGVLVAAFKDMKTVLKDLGPAFTKLQDGISAKFWKQAAQPIREMVNSLMPTLKTQLEGTATALGGMFAAGADAIKNIPIPYIEQMFTSMNKGIDAAKAGVAPMVNTFATLGLAASMYFERFGTWIADLSTRLNNFINAAADDGRLIGWIDAMIEGFKNLGRALDGLFGIFNALDSAATAAGFGGLKTFADNLQAVAAGLQSAGAQTALTQLMSGMLILTQKVGEALFKLGDPLASIMPTVNLALSAIGDAVATVIGYIGQILSNPQVQKGITDFTNGIKAAVDALAPAIEPFANSLGGMMSLLGQIIVNVAKIASAFTTTLGPVMDQMSKQFETLVAPLGDAVVNLITVLGPVAQQINDSLVGPIVDGIKNYIIPGFNDMMTALAPVAQQMVAALGPVLESLLPLIPPIFELATTIGTVLMQAVAAVAPLFVTLMTAIMPIVNAIVQLVNMIAPFLVPAIEKISAALSPVIAVIGQVVGAILSVLVPVLGIVIIGVINNVVGVIEGFSNVFMGVVNIITALITGFGAFFTKLFSGDIGGAIEALGTMFADIWNGIMQVIGGALEFIWNAVQLMFIGKLVGGLKSALSSLGGFFKGAWDDMFNAVKNAMGNINGTVTSILGGVRNFIESAWNGALTIVRNAWQWMQDAVSGGVNGVMGFVQGLPGKIGGALGNLGGLLTRAGNAIMQGFLDGLKATWGAVTSFVGGIADWIAQHKGPIPYDRQLLVPAGEAIMQGLGAGLKGQMSNLLATLQAITGGVTDAVTEGLAHSKMYLAGADAALGLSDGLLANKSKVIDALGVLTPDTSLSAKVTGPGSGVGAPTPTVPGTVVNVESGAITLASNTTQPETAADMVLDGLVNAII